MIWLGAPSGRELWDTVSCIQQVQNHSLSSTLDMKIWVFGEAMHAHTVLMTTSGSSILNSAVWSRVWNIPNFLESCRARNFVFIESARKLQNPEWSDSNIIRYTMGDSRFQVFHCCSSSNSVSLVMSESLSAHETYRAHGLILTGILHHWSQLIKNLYLSSVARHELKMYHLSLLESPLQWECWVQQEKNNLYLILLECFSPPQKYEKNQLGSASHIGFNRYTHLLQINLVCWKPPFKLDGSAIDFPIKSGFSS